MSINRGELNCSKDTFDTASVSTFVKVNLRCSLVVTKLINQRVRSRIYPISCTEFDAAITVSYDTRSNLRCESTISTRESHDSQARAVSPAFFEPRQNLERACFSTRNPTPVNPRHLPLRPPPSRKSKEPVRKRERSIQRRSRGRTDGARNCIILVLIFTRSSSPLPSPDK